MWIQIKRNTLGLRETCKSTGINEYKMWRYCSSEAFAISPIRVNLNKNLNDFWGSIFKVVQFKIQKVDSIIFFGNNVHSSFLPFEFLRYSIHSPDLAAIIRGERAEFPNFNPCWNCYLHSFLFSRRFTHLIWPWCQDGRHPWLLGFQLFLLYLNWSLE